MSGVWLWLAVFGLGAGVLTWVVTSAYVYRKLAPKKVWQAGWDAGTAAAVEMAQDVMTAPYEGGRLLLKEHELPRNPYE